MWNKSDVYMEDLQNIISKEYIQWDSLNGKTVLITGATGLIGSNIVNALLYANQHKQLDITVAAVVRSIERAKTILGNPSDFDDKLVYIEGSVEALPEIDMDIDYIIHGASPTASSFFVNNPVETIKTAVWGTDNMLQLAREKQVKGFVYLSSMEVYGSPLADDKLYETAATTIDTMAVRSCYPEAKRMCENMCASYSSEYGVPTAVARLSQTFGPGVSKDDNRVFAEFARCAMNGKDIILRTKGDSKRTYIYTADAVSAILVLMLNGISGNAYNISNPRTYCSIYEMAEMVSKELADNRINIVINATEESMKKYPPAHHLNLQCDKLMMLGWKPEVNLKDMYLRMISDMIGE